MLELHPLQNASSYAEYEMPNEYINPPTNTNNNNHNKINNNNNNNNKNDRNNDDIKHLLQYGLGVRNRFGFNYFLCPLHSERV